MIINFDNNICIYCYPNLLSNYVGPSLAKKRLVPGALRWVPGFLKTSAGTFKICALGLPSECTIYDVSNACLGQLNGIISAANAIELGQMDAVLVVGTEDSRPLVENTIESLNNDSHWTRQTIKMAVASLDRKSVV